MEDYLSVICAPNKGCGQMHLNCIKLPRQGSPPERGSLNREGKTIVVSSRRRGSLAWMIPSAAGGRRSEEFIARNKEHGRVKRDRWKRPCDYITRWAVQIPPSPYKIPNEIGIFFLCLLWNIFLFNFCNKKTRSFWPHNILCGFYITVKDWRNRKNMLFWKSGEHRKGLPFGGWSLS